MKFRLSDTLVLFVSLFLLAAKSPAFEPPSPAPLPNFDKRTDGLQAGDVVSGNQRAAVEQLRLRLPLARVDFDPVTSAPKMISAGQVSNTFNLTLVDNSVPDGHQTVTVTASAPLLANGSASIFVIDDESPPPPSNPRPGHLAVNVPANTNLMWNNGPSSSNELVINGGFETGTLTNWVLVPGVYGHFAINNGSFDPPSPDGPLPPYAGSFSALAYPTGPGIFYMYQDISIPSGTSFATLSWAHRVRNFYKSFSTSQQFQVQLCDTNNNVLAVAFTTNPGDPLLDNWIQKSYDLTLFAGQKLRVRFLVNPGMNYLDVHLDNVSVQVGSTASGITNDVYFGTNPTPGPAEFKGSTTNLSWTLPLLSPLTTYYWQIVAHKGGTVTGPVWQFTTKGVDHFVWNTISSPQYVNQPFGVTITAKDSFNSTVSNFTGTASLYNAASNNIGVNMDFEAGTLAPWVPLNASSSPGPYQLVPFDVNGDGVASTAFRIAANSGTPDGITQNVMLIAGNAYTIDMDIASTNGASGSNTDGGTAAILIGGMNVAQYSFGSISGNHTLRNHLHGTFTPITNGIYAVTLTFYRAYLETTVWSLADDLRISGTITPVSIVPTISGNFVNGIWTGNITVQQPATNVVLQADDGNQHTGSSNPFDVTVTNDISISILDSPDPVSVGASLTYTLTVANTGPSAATGVSVTNLLPASAAFISATSSQGTCTQSGVVVTCDLGVVPGGTNATIAIVVVPTVAGTTLTNSATVSRVEADPYMGNNAALVTTVVTTPAISIADASVVEGNVGTTNMVFALTLAAANAQTITVNYATANAVAVAGTDYVSINGVLTFPPGTTNGTITVAVIGDTLIETNETFFVNLSGPVNGTLGRSQGVGTIINDDGFPGQVDHFTWSVIGSPQYANVPFGVTINAWDALNNPVTNFTGAVSLYSTPSNSVVPTVSDNFTNGIWNGNVAVLNRATNAMLVADDGNGHFGLSNPFDLVPANMPPVILAEPTNQTVVMGGTAMFTVVADGTPPLSYQWNFNGTNIAGATNTPLTLTNVQFSQAGSYAVLVTNLFGSVLSSNAVLTVNLPPAVPAITGFSPIAGSAGTSVTLFGTNFSPVASNNIVYFGAVQAGVVSASVTNLVVTVPTGATYAPITVTVNGLTAYANQPFMPTFFGDGSGITVNSFVPLLDLASGSGPIRVIIADLDGDGKPDLIVANDYNNSISLYRNISTNGSLTAGSFASRVDLVTPPGSYSPFGLVVADVDGDGKLDIIVSDYDESIVSVYRNTCTPGNISSNAFATRVDFATGAQPKGVEVRDIDGDGKPDLLVANSGDGTVSILRNTGVMGSLTTNSFAPKVDIVTGSGCQGVAAGDLDGDGKPDVVTVNNGNGTVSLLRNISTPGSITTNSFAAKVDIAVLSGAVQVAIGDLDGDGKPDLAVTFYLPQTVSVLRNTSTVGSLTTNSFAPRIDYPLGGRGHTPAIADLDGDGKPDVAVVTELNSLLSIFRNVSTPGSFTNSSLASRVDFSTGYNAWGVAIGDLDGDGRPDIVFCNSYDNTISIYRNVTPFGGPPVITLQPTNQTVFVGGDVTFTVTASSALPLSYQWNFNGANISGATNTTLTLTNVQLSQAGNYRVLVTNAVGSILSSNAVLTVNPLQSCDPPPSGLVAWWPGEGSANDIVGMNNGLLENVTFTNGMVGQAFVFDGSSSLIRVPASPSLNVGLGGGFTIEVWIKPANLNLQELCEWNQNNGDPFGAAQIGTHMEINEAPGDGSFWGNIIDTAANAHVLNSTTGVITTNSFQHLAMTYDKTSGVAVLYRNGVVVATANLGMFTPQTSFDFFMGDRPSGFFTGIYFQGEMDEPAVYNRALSAAEIQAIYSAGSVGKCPPTLTPPVITTQPTNQTVTVGGTASFSVVASGTSPLSYQWSFGGTNIVGATNTLLTLTNVQLNQAGNYAVLVTNLYGSILSSNAVLTVNLPPAVPAITGFSPIVGPAGTNVTIFGTNFSPVASNNIVYFGAVRAVVTAASVTNLVATVPVGATYAPITETVNGLTAYANSPFLPIFSGGGALSSSSLSGPTNLTAGSGPVRVVIGDLDGDGKPDVIVANVYDATVYIYRNISTNGTLGAASFAPPVIFTIGGGLWGLALADLEGDGRLDIVVANQNYNNVSIFQNQCSPGSITTNSFGARVDFPVGPGPTGVAVQDLDGDGKPEIVTANYGGTTVSVLPNIGTMGSITTNSFAPSVSFTVGPTPVDVMIADVDGDGKADVVTVNNGSSSQAMSVLRNLSTLGNIAFATNVDFPGLPTSYCLAIGDLDGDGKPDVVIGSQPDGQSVSVYRNTSTPGSITTNSFAAQVDFAAGGWANSVAIGDLDGDGKPDVAVVTQIPDHLSLFKNVSVPGSFTTNSFAARVDFSAGWNPNGVVIGDLDGDGRPDITFGNTYDGTISIYQNEVPFGGPPSITSQPTNQTVAVGGTANFSVTASGSLPLSYQWNFNGTNIAGATNTTLTLTNVQFSQAGNYAVTVTNAYDSATSSNAVLTVTLDHFAWNPIPSPRFVNTPFSVIIRAQDMTNGLFTNFTGTAILGTTNGVAVTPPISGNFIQGVWTGSVMISQTASNLVLQADDGRGHFGLANPINVISLPRLGMLRSGNIALYMWPVGYSGFVLETSGSLSPATWVVVPYSPIQIGDQYLLPLDMTGTNGFYRLWFPGP